MINNFNQKLAIEIKTAQKDFKKSMKVKRKILKKINR